MQGFEYSPCQRTADAWHARQFLLAGATHTLQATEVRQQRSAACGADAWNFLQRRLDCGLLPAPAVPGDGEAVRLVANLLNQVRSR